MSDDEIPALDKSAVDPQLAIVVVLEVAVVAAARTIVAAHPDLDLAVTDHADPELLAARALVDQCESLRYYLADYRCRVFERLDRFPSDPDDWPF